MIKRVKTSIGVLAGLAVLALGGAAMAGAASTSTHPKQAVHEVVRPDTDNIQSGDQTTPDTGSKKGREVVGPDTDNIQSGDQTTPDTGSKARRQINGTLQQGSQSTQQGSQTTPDTGSTSETAGESTSETAGESAPGNDGPGGWADEPANPNADTQQTGQN